jgi:hypothetical protein
MKFLQEEAGVEPTALKIMAGVILLGIGLGIGVAVYKTVGTAVTAMKCTVYLEKSSTTIIRENTDIVRIDITLLTGTAGNATLSVTGKPENVDVTFDPSSGIPPFYSNMTVHVENMATAGNYVLTILAKDSNGATSGSASLGLIIQ